MEKKWRTLIVPPFSSSSALGVVCATELFPSSDLSMVGGVLQGLVEALRLLVSVCDVWCVCVYVCVYALVWFCMLCRMIAYHLVLVDHVFCLQAVRSCFFSFELFHFVRPRLQPIAKPRRDGALFSSLILLVRREMSNIALSALRQR